MFFNMRKDFFQQLGVWRGSSYSLLISKPIHFLSKLLKKALGPKGGKAVGRALNLIFVLF